MVFSNPVFVFMFFPITFLVYFLLKDKNKNAWLLLCSLFFYAWSGISFLLVLLFSVLINWILGRYLGRRNKVALIVGVCFNLCLLGFFKYSVFFVENIMGIFGRENVIENIPFLSNIVLPVGVSFYTFQILAYDIDVYFQKVAVQKSYSKLLLYVIMFPQLIAGPIVRYIDVEAQIHKRRCDWDYVYYGLRRFIYGLSKKVLLADSLGALAEQIYAVGDGTLISWMLMLTYSLQIYFDFSGYSDMAIGMGKMLGFDFLENFDNPYHSKSIKEFWRRWHISLSSWFRDYLYIPLGGNRKGKLVTYRNLFFVFLATGLWHGASWNFVIWGLWHGFFLIVERLGLGKVLDKIPVVLQRVYTLLIVGMGWLMFRTEDLQGNVASIITLFKYKRSPIGEMAVLLEPKMLVCLMVAILMCVLGTKKRLKSEFVRDVFAIILFVIVILQISTSNFSPFLYFRF